jgi:hypothetical protein
MKGHKEHHHGKHKKASGGRTGLIASGNPDVIKEAEGKEDYAKGDEKKHGGRAKHKRAAGGKVIGLMIGGAVKPRQDRPARKSGGRVGSDRSPMSSAHMHAKPGTAPAEEEGGQPD